MKKTTVFIAGLGYITSAALMAGSFFIKDNAKAVKYRYISLGVFGGSLAVQFAANKLLKA